MATNDRDLDGQVVAVIGATGGLGSALCDGLGELGATIVTANRSGGTDVQLDLRDARAGDLLVQHVSETHDRLDGVIVAAGIVAFGDVADTDDITVEELFLTNAMGPMWLARRVEPLLAESQGFFVNISGVVADTPMPGMAAYSASKAAAAAAMTALGKEWRRRKITVLDARPPHTETGLADHPLAGTAPKMVDGLTAAGRRPDRRGHRRRQSRVVRLRLRGRSARRVERRAGIARAARGCGHARASHSRSPGS